LGDFFTNPSNRPGFPTKYFLHEMAAEAGRRDWANFRQLGDCYQSATKAVDQLGDCLLWAVFF
jgi:hypothetical protein